MNWNRVKVGALTLIIILVFNVFFSFSEWFYNVFYLKSTFQVFRVLHDYTIGFLPIPSIYIIAPVFIGYFFIKKSKNRFWWIESIVSCFIWIVIAFYLFWAFNYNQPSIYKLAQLEPIKIDSVYITQVYNAQTILMDSILNNEAKLEFNLDIIELESELRDIQENIIQEWGIPTVGRVRVRKLFKGSLLHLRTSGIYIPHAFEGHMDGGIYDIQFPFTMAHEMAHGYGITDESVCNFIAYLTCIKSDNILIRFSAELAYWRYLVGYYRYFHAENWTEEYKALNPELRYHLDEIRRHSSMYKDWMPKYRDIIYDNYLKTHGVKAGIRSYNQMILLIAAWNSKFSKEQFSN